MANKPASKNWNDVQLLIATGSMALTLFFWNQFGAPDRASAMKHDQERTALPPPLVQTAAPLLDVQPTLQSSPIPTGPILLGGSAPQTTIIVQKGGGGGGATSTGSS
jgi:hypothetical protein